MRNESMREKLNLSRLLPNPVGLFLVAFGSIILACVGWLTWYDMTTWGKDVALIFFGSRIGEAISLGIGMKVIYYFLTGLALLLLGLFTFLRRGIKENPVVKPLVEEDNVRALEEKSFSECLHHFGYLASLPKNASVPKECLTCLKMLECRNRYRV